MTVPESGVVITLDGLSDGRQKQITSFGKLIASLHRHLHCTSARTPSCLLSYQVIMSHGLAMLNAGHA